jgi:FKBP-type peptidyl-prolyl cis-trans isomerase
VILGANANLDISSSSSSSSSSMPTTDVSEAPSSSSSSSSSSSFDNYQPGVTQEIVWRDDTTTTTSVTSSNNSNDSAPNNYRAQTQDVCIVSYTGTILNSGQRFSDMKEFAFQIDAGQSLPGFDVGCIGMVQGGVRTIRVPPNRAYGTRGTLDGRVPPNADLELVVTMNRLVSYEQSAILAQLALFGELRLIGLLGCVAVLALPPLFQ